MIGSRRRGARDSDDLSSKQPSACHQSVQTASISYIGSGVKPVFAATSAAPAASKHRSLIVSELSPVLLARVSCGACRFKLASGSFFQQSCDE